MLDGSTFGVHYCRWCDSAPYEKDDGFQNRRAGPPSLGYTDPNGIFPIANDQTGSV